jgi:hypothetical protein
MSPDKGAALSALRTWRTITEDRDRLVRAAKSTGATWDQIIDASGLARGTVAGILAPKSAKAPRLTRTNTGALVQHHPHFGGYDPVGFADEAYMFRPFSGLEDPPLAPDRLTGETDAAYSQRVDRAEWRAAWARWREAYLRLKARGPLTAMAAGWADCVTAQAEMTAAFDRLVTGPDGQWRANINILLEARGKALVAATSWDEAATNLLLLRANDLKLRDLNERAVSLYGPAGTAAEPYRDWDKAARDLGIDTSGWAVAEVSGLDDIDARDVQGSAGRAYRDGLEREIAAQDTRIDGINRLTMR